MEDLIHIQKTFEKVILLTRRSVIENLKIVFFKNCDLSDFSNNTFMDCEFIDCNLSMTSLMGTSLKRFVLVIVNY
jgi:uncharacterized protein YjbI with pentapeptide repeats